MTVTTYTYALTTLANVKARLGITVSTSDDQLKALINATTDFIERETGGRKFLKTTYTHDTYSIYGSKQKYLILRQRPVWSLAVLEWRAGTPTTPNWTAFIADQYELIDPQYDPYLAVQYYPDGIVRIYGVMPRLYNNMIRATYDAGYLIDFANVGDRTKHNLPADLTQLCEDLVVRWWKRRELAGKSSEGTSGMTTSWKSLLDSDDLTILQHYTLITPFT